MTTPGLTSVERALQLHFGQPPSRASMSFVGVEPIEVLRFRPSADDRVFVTLGMSRRPMTSTTDYVLATDGPRAELMLAVHDPREEFAGVWRTLAVLAAAPVVEGIVHTPGATLDLTEPITPGSRCTGVVLAEPELATIATEDGPVDVLTVVPATATELAWCRVHGSLALRERWTEHGTDLLDLGRAPVALD